MRSFLSTSIFILLILLHPLPGPSESHRLPHFAAQWHPHQRLSRKTRKSQNAPGLAVPVSVCACLCQMCGVYVCWGAEGNSWVKVMLTFYLSIPLYFYSVESTHTFSLALSFFLCLSCVVSKALRPTMCNRKILKLDGASNFHF